MKIHATFVARLAIAASAFSLAGAALAADATYVITGNQTVATQYGNVNVYSAPGENSGGGSTAPTSAQPDNNGGNGSLEIHGDRSREVIGDIYGNGTNNIFSLASLQSVTFDKFTAVTTASQLHAEPVLRVHGYDSNLLSRFELIDEGVYNGGTAGVSPTLGTWVPTDGTQNWYVNVRSGGAAFLAANAGNGVTLSGGLTGVVFVNGSQYNAGLTNLYSFFSGNTGVSGFSVGAGSGFGSGWLGYADNVKVATTTGSLTFDFEANAVPEPASWALMLVGFGAMGGAMRMSRKGRNAIA